MATKTKRTTTDALEIIDDLFFRGRPEMYAMLEQARERLRISMRLCELREKSGLTQAELAERAGTSRTVIARLEGTTYEKHTMSTLRKVAGAMGYAVKVDFIPVAEVAAAAATAATSAKTSLKGRTKSESIAVRSTSKRPTTSRAAGVKASKRKSVAKSANAKAVRKTAKKA